MDKNIRKLFLRPILFFIFILIFIFSITGCNDEEKFIEKNRSVIDLNKHDLKQFSIMDEDVNKSKIIFVNNDILIKYSSDLTFELIKYLNKKFDVEYILIDDSFCMAQMINDYLETGNDYYLKKSYYDISPVYLYFYKKIYEYNKYLKSNKKIKVIGFSSVVDNIQNILSFFYYVNGLFKEKNIPFELKEPVNRNKIMFDALYYDKSTDIDLIGDDRRENFYKFVKTFLKIIENDIEKYRKLIADDFNDFYFILKNCIEDYNLLKNNNFSIYSEKYRIGLDNLIYKRFLYYYNNYLKGSKKFLALFPEKSSVQTFQEGKNFAILLKNSDSDFKSKVLSIRYLFLKCKRVFNIYNEKEIDYRLFDETYSSSIQSDFVKVLEKYIVNDITLFRLTGKNSIFSKKGKVIFHYPVYLKEKVSTLDFFQYIFVVKNSIKF